MEAQTPCHKRGSMLLPLRKENGLNHSFWRSQPKIGEDQKVPYITTILMRSKESRNPLDKSVNDRVVTLAEMYIFPPEKTKRTWCTAPTIKRKVIPSSSALPFRKILNEKRGAGIGGRVDSFQKIDHFNLSTLKNQFLLEGGHSEQSFWWSSAYRGYAVLILAL